MTDSLLPPGAASIIANRFPVKHLWDTAALVKTMATGKDADGRAASLAARINCARFYFFEGGPYRLHAAAPRSGQSWSELGMSLAVDLARGGDGEYTYEKDLFFPRDGLVHRRLDWRIPLGHSAHMYPRSNGPALAEPIFYHTRNPYYRVRSARLKNMRIVVQVRNILDSLESRFVKLATAAHLETIKLNDESSFDWNAAMDRAITFFNSWGDVLTWHRHAFAVRYEDLKRDPVAGHREVLAFWGLDIPEDCVREGFCRAERSEMLKRIPSAERGDNAEAGNRSASKRGILSSQRKAAIVARLDRELRHTFGYDFDADMAYGLDLNARPEGTTN
ncbi:MAG: sulfotransferase domain-containing protein [Rhodospirillales bacterium]